MRIFGAIYEYKLASWSHSFPHFFDDNIGFVLEYYFLEIVLKKVTLKAKKSKKYLLMTQILQYNTYITVIAGTGFH